MPTQYTGEQVYEILEREIVHLRIKPGEFISENGLCSRFSVSRTPIRGALQRLQENGLVQIVPHKETKVTLMDYRIVNQIIYQRVAVETMVLRDFIKACSPTDIEIVRFAYQNLVKVGEKYTADPEHFDDNLFLREDFKMHETWFRAVGKLYLWEQLSRVQASYSRFCVLDILSGCNVEEVLEDHGQFMQMIDDLDARNVEALLRRHLYGGVRRLAGKIFQEYSGYFIPESLVQE